MTRFGQVIGLDSTQVEKYKQFHNKIWPEIAAMIRNCNIKNYSIFYKDGQLFAYFEYHGSNFMADMEKMAADPKTQEWWSIMEPMQRPVENRQEGEWWASMEEVFHLD